MWRLHLIPNLIKNILAPAQEKCKTTLEPIPGYFLQFFKISQNLIPTANISLLPML